MAIVSYFDGSLQLTDSDICKSVELFVFWTQSHTLGVPVTTLQGLITSCNSIVVIL